MKKSNTTTTITTIFTIFLTTMSWQLLKEKYLIFKLLIAQIELKILPTQAYLLRKKYFKILSIMLLKSSVVGVEVKEGLRIQ